jgi:hypothetical protein
MPVSYRRLPALPRAAANWRESRTVPHRLVFEIREKFLERLLEGRGLVQVRHVAGVAQHHLARVQNPAGHVVVRAHHDQRRRLDLRQIFHHQTVVLGQNAAGRQRQTFGAAVLLVVRFGRSQTGKAMFFEVPGASFGLRLKERGLHGVEFVVSDDHAGLKKAIGEVLPEAAWHRCYGHFLRNAPSITCPATPTRTACRNCAGSTTGAT